MKTSKVYYETPMVAVLLLQAEPVMEKNSGELQDFTNNPIYRENF